MVGHIICQIRPEHTKMRAVSASLGGCDCNGISASEELNVWLAGHSVQSLNGSRGPGQPRAAFLQPGKAAGCQWSRAGQRAGGLERVRELQRISRQKAAEQARWAGGRPPLGTCPGPPAGWQAGRRTSTVGKSQRATRPHSKHRHHQPNSFFLETFIWA